MSPLSIPDRFVLASSSPRRQELVAALGLNLPVRILTTGADETITGSMSPEEIVTELSFRKASAAASLLEQEGQISTGGDLVLGADTIVVLDGRVLGKPEDEEDAVRSLMMLSGRVHEVYTGVSLLACPDGRSISRWSRTQVQMKAYDKAAARRYTATGEPMDKAGSYGIQGRGAVLVDRIDGCYFNVVGLPLSLLADMLAEFGVQVI